MTASQEHAPRDATRQGMTPDGAEVAADAVRDVLAGCYAEVLSGTHRTVADTYSFETAAPLWDPIMATARSRHPALNELAVARRLCQTFVRAGFGLAADTGLTVRSILWRQHPLAPHSGAAYALTLDSASSMRNRLDEIRVTLTRHSAMLGNTTAFTFGVLTGSAVRFIRRSRDFSNYDEVAIERQDSQIKTVSPGRFAYLASEADRCIDGSRMDHVPAIVLSDIVYAIIGKDRNFFFHDGVWTFPYYTDPRSEFIIETDPEAQSVRVEQGGRVTVTFEAVR